MNINPAITLMSLRTSLERTFELSAQKIDLISKTADTNGTPVYTVNGRYTSRGWTEWTQGFLFGSAILQFDATGEEKYLDMGRSQTLKHMAAHATHTGVHDHGFNNVSTYGNLRRLMLAGSIPHNEWELRFYELALRASGAVQAARWSPTAYGSGYIQSFNGPHSLFADTIRTLRILAIAHQLGHVLQGEGDRRISLLGRLIEHARTTAMFNVYYDSGRDHYDQRGRVAHESIFNMSDGCYRCPSSQQGYSPFSTWTRGLAWVITGYAELLEFMQSITADEVVAASKSMGQPTAYYNAKPPAGVANIPATTKDEVVAFMLEAACAAADFWIQNTPSDGISYWDTGAPGLQNLGDYLNKPADPYNQYEPVDSSAAAIAAQGLLRLGRYLSMNDRAEGDNFTKAGLLIAQTLMQEPYLSEDPQHQGLLLHSIYHRPNGWDHVPAGSRISHSESSLWGDYHLRELALYLWRQIENRPYYTFWS